MYCAPVCACDNILYIIVMTEYSYYAQCQLYVSVGNVCCCAVWVVLHSGAAAVSNFCAESWTDDGWPQWQWQVHGLAGPDEGSGATGGCRGSGPRDRAKGEPLGVEGIGGEGEVEEGQEVGLWLV